MMFKKKNTSKYKGLGVRNFMEALTMNGTTRSIITTGTNVGIFPFVNTTEFKDIDFLYIIRSGSSRKD